MGNKTDSPGKCRGFLVHCEVEGVLIHKEREVATPFDGQTNAGEYHQVKLDASRLSSGIYVARLESNGKHLMKKMLLLK